MTKFDFDLSDVKITEKNGLFCVNDLLNYFNSKSERKRELNGYFRSKRTKNFIFSLMTKYNVPREKILKTERGKYGGSYFCYELLLNFKDWLVGSPNERISRFEEELYIRLKTIFNGICNIVSQYPVLGYRVDFYIPEYNIAIEHDGREHNSPSAKEKDKIREKKIRRKLGCEFIRVKEGEEVEFLNKLIKLIMEEDNAKQQAEERREIMKMFMGSPGLANRFIEDNFIVKKV